MTQYIETTTESKMIALQEIANRHFIEMGSKSCTRVVNTKKNLTEDKWLFNYDLFKENICTCRRAERIQEIGTPEEPTSGFVGNTDGIYFIEYADDYAAGIKVHEVE